MRKIILVFFCVFSLNSIAQIDDFNKLVITLIDEVMDEHYLRISQRLGIEDMTIQQIKNLSTSQAKKLQSSIARETLKEVPRTNRIIFSTIFGFYLDALKSSKNTQFLNLSEKLRKKVLTSYLYDAGIVHEWEGKNTTEAYDQIAKMIQGKMDRTVQNYLIMKDLDIETLRKTEFHIEQLSSMFNQDIKDRLYPGFAEAEDSLRSQISGVFTEVKTQSQINEGQRFYKSFKFHVAVNSAFHETQNKETLLSLRSAEFSLLGSSGEISDLDRSRLKGLLGSDFNQLLQTTKNSLKSNISKTFKMTVKDRLFGCGFFLVKVPWMKL